MFTVYWPNVIIYILTIYHVVHVHTCRSAICIIESVCTTCKLTILCGSYLIVVEKLINGLVNT